MKKMLLRGVLSCCVLAACSAAADEGADADILVSNSNVLYEYSSSGTLVSQMPIPQNGSDTLTEQARDLIVLGDGRIAVYNGTFYPELSVYDGTQWQHFKMEGWSTINNVSFGGIAAVGSKIYATDNATGGGEAKGLVEIDIDANTTTRYLSDNEYIDVTLGADGLLYALRNVYGDLDVIDPASVTIIRTLDLGHTSDSRAVTANAAGDIFMASWNGDVTRYDSSGVLTASLYIGGNLADIDLDGSGRLLVSNRAGSVYLTDEALLSYREIRDDGSSHVSFAAFKTPPAAPTPPRLSGSHFQHGRWIYTTLSWTTDAAAVDVYRNGELIDTVFDVNTSTYRYSKKLSQSYTVCRAGTTLCSEAYTAK